jgi:hypothetical protein
MLMGRYPYAQLTEDKEKLNAIEMFMNGSDDSTVKVIKDLCGHIVDVDDITRDKLKSGNLALDVKARALAFRETNTTRSGEGQVAAQFVAVTSEAAHVRSAEAGTATPSSVE